MVFRFICARSFSEHYSDTILLLNLKERIFLYALKMSRRGKLDIIADILTAANRGSKKTKLVYATNTNFVLMKEYLQMLEKRGLVLEYDAKIYTTDAGREYLLYYSGLTHLLKNNIRGDYADIKTSVQARKQ